MTAECRCSVAVWIRLCKGSIFLLSRLGNFTFVIIPFFSKFNSKQCLVPKQSVVIDHCKSCLELHDMLDFYVLIHTWEKVKVLCHIEPLKQTQNIVRPKNDLWQIWWESLLRSRTPSKKVTFIFWNFSESSLPNLLFEMFNLNKGHGGHLLLPILNFYSPHTNMKEQIII